MKTFAIYVSKYGEEIHDYVATVRADSPDEAKEKFLVYAKAHDLMLYRFAQKYLTAVLMM